MKLSVCDISLGVITSSSESLGRTLSFMCPLWHGTLCALDSSCLCVQAFICTAGHNLIEQICLLVQFPAHSVNEWMNRV